METSVFDVVLPYHLVGNHDDAIAMFNELAGDVSDVDFEYDFDYEFRGRDDEGWLFSVYIETEHYEDAYEVMEDKFDEETQKRVIIYWD